MRESDAPLGGRSRMRSRPMPVCDFYLSPSTQCRKRECCFETELDLAWTDFAGIDQQELGQVAFHLNAEFLNEFDEHAGNDAILVGRRRGGYFEDDGA